MSPIRPVTSCYHCHLSLLGTKSSSSPALSIRKYHPTECIPQVPETYSWHYFNKREAHGKLSIQLRAWEGTYHNCDKSHKSANENHTFLKEQGNNFSFLGFQAKKILNPTASNPVQISKNQNTVVSKGEVHRSIRIGNGRMYTMS